jgi:hypothetical protein
MILQLVRPHSGQSENEHEVTSLGAQLEIE